MKKIFILFIPIILFLTDFTSNVSGQTGSIGGRISDSKSGQPLTGTTIILEGTTIGALSDIDGKFEIRNIKPGSYNVKISFVSYKEKLIRDVKVEAGRSTKVETSLDEETIGLSNVTVTAVRRTNTDLSIISDVKTSSFVSIGISSQQISKTLDKDASEVVKRVPGITIQDDRFIIVRGLSERYNNVWLNNSATPSSEADVRAFSFDIIPSSMIENILIIKSSAAELPADFSGGFVKITTKNMPEKNSVVLSYGSSFSEGTTFGKFFKYDGSKTDLLGFDGKTRALPSDMPSHLNIYDQATNPDVRNLVTALGQQLNKIWTPYNKTALPDQKALIGINSRFNIGKHQAGNVASISYSWSNNKDIVDVTDYTIYDYVNDKPSYLNQFVDQRYTNSVRIALMDNFSLLAGNGTKIEFRNLFNQAGYTRTSMRYGREWYNDGRYIKSEELRYLSRSIYTGQLAGEHRFSDDQFKIDWVAGYSYSAKNEPDTKRFRYIQSQQDTSKFMMLFGDQADLSSQSRTWIYLNENTLNVALNLTFSPQVGSIRPEIKAGLYLEDKVRSFHARNFGYAKASNNSLMGQTMLPVEDVFTNANINLDSGIRLMEVTALSDSYSASNRQISGYASARIPFSPKLTLYAGIRVERNRQTLSSYNQGSTIKVDVKRDTINVFPSANLIYDFNEKNIMRFAYGMSVNRPEFREIAPFYYVDFEINAGIYGAPDIRQSYIHNLDLRYEFYPEKGETFSAGVFYKYFISPIEQVILGNSPTQYSFENVNSAFSTGIETEVRKSLSFIQALENFTLVMNASLIKSRVQFDSGTLSRNRSLEGQSPYIVNAGLFYQNDNKGLMISMMYNVIGKRITAVGRPSPNSWEDIPDVYEMPRNVIDLTFSKMIGKKVEIKGGIKDLLNQPVKYEQNVNTYVDMSTYAVSTDKGLKYFDRNQITKYYVPGRTLILGLSLKF